LKRALILAAVAIAALLIYRRRRQLGAVFGLVPTTYTDGPAYANTGIMPPDFTHGGLLNTGLPAYTSPPPAAIVPMPATIVLPPSLPPGVGPGPSLTINAPTYNAPALNLSAIARLPGIADVPADPAPIAPPPAPRPPSTPPRQAFDSNDPTNTTSGDQILPDPAPAPRPAPNTPPPPRPTPAQQLAARTIATGGAGGGTNNAAKQIMAAKDTGGRIKSVPRNASDGN
jgi:hypothetical protein